MHGTELCARFSYITNHLRFCGPHEAEAAILALLRGKGDATDVEAQLRRFEGVLPYLETIAARHGKQPFDADVVEAYWIGNSLLDDITDDDVKKAILSLAERGLPKSLATRLIQRLPPGMTLHHNFNVLYVGVGQLTGSVTTTLPNMEQCRISAGRVLGVQKDTLQVAVRPLIVDGDLISRGEEETRTAVYLADVLRVEKGDTVALHWGYVPATLTLAQADALENATRRILTALPRHDTS